MFHAAYFPLSNVFLPIFMQYCGNSSTRVTCKGRVAAHVCKLMLPWNTENEIQNWGNSMQQDPVKTIRSLDPSRPWQTINTTFLCFNIIYCHNAFLSVQMGIINVSGVISLQGGFTIPHEHTMLLLTLADIFLATILYFIVSRILLEFNFLTSIIL